MSLSRSLFASAALLGLVFASQPTRAAVVVTALPPGTVVPITLAGPSDPLSGTLLYQNTLVYSTATYDATVAVAVLRDSTTGKLDFIYQVSNTSDGITKNDNISQIATTSFKFVDIQTTGSGFGAGYSQTAVNYTGGPGSISFVVPTTTGAGTAPTASRPNTTGADTIDFFRNTASPLTPGSVGNILFLRTNADAFEFGNLAVIDGIAGNNPSPVPAVVPEPSTMLISLVGLPLVGGYRWLRRRRS